MRTQQAVTHRASTGSFRSTPVPQAAGISDGSGACDRAFDKARKKLHMPALQWLNARLLDMASHLISLWHGLRVVAADCSTLQTAIRTCHRSRSAASPNQVLFAMYLPGAELTLHASVHSSAIGERAMLAEALGHLGPTTCWCLTAATRPPGWSSSSSSAASASSSAATTPAAGPPRAPSCAAATWTPQAKMRVMVTNLRPDQVPTAAIAELYHQRWRVEEALKRLKHVQYLESARLGAQPAGPHHRRRRQGAGRQHRLADVSTAPDDPRSVHWCVPDYPAMLGTSVSQRLLNICMQSGSRHFSIANRYRYTYLLRKRRLGCAKCAFLS